MKKIVFIGFALLLCVGMNVFALDAGAQERVRFATGGTAGVYYAFGSAVGGVFKERTGIPITVQSTGASRANILLVNEGEVEMALVQNDVMDYAWRGVNLFEKDGKITTFSSMAGIYPETCQIITTAGTGIKSVADFRGKSVSVGDAGSGVEFNAAQIMEAYGLTFNDIKKQNLSFAASADALRDGRIDAFFVTAGTPTPAIVDLAMARDVVVLPVSDADLSRLTQRYPFYSRDIIPAGTYKGMTAPVPTVAVKAAFIVSNKLSEATVYQLTRALFVHRDQIAQAHFRGNDISGPNAVDGISVPFHPGAARYLKEIGALK